MSRTIYIYLSLSLFLSPLSLLLSPPSLSRSVYLSIYLPIYPWSFSMFMPFSLYLFIILLRFSITPSLYLYQRVSPFYIKKKAPIYLPSYLSITYLSIYRKLFHYICLFHFPYLHFSKTPTIYLPPPPPPPPRSPPSLHLSQSPHQYNPLTGNTTHI